MKESDYWLIVLTKGRGITWKLQRIQNLFPEQRLKHVIFLMSSRPLKETRKQRSVLSWESLKQWSSTRGDFVIGGHLVMSEDMLDCHSWGRYWSLVGRPRGQGSSHMHRAAPTAKNYPLSQFNRAEIEKLQTKITCWGFSTFSFKVVILHRELKNGGLGPSMSNEFCILSNHKTKIPF